MPINKKSKDGQNISSFELAKKNCHKTTSIAKIIITFTQTNACLASFEHITSTARDSLLQTQCPQEPNSISCSSSPLKIFYRVNAPFSVATMFIKKPKSVIHVIVHLCPFLIYSCQFDSTGCFDPYVPDTSHL